jgi:hypothetical protein
MKYLSSLHERRPPAFGVRWLDSAFKPKDFYLNALSSRQIPENSV